MTPETHEFIRAHRAEGAAAISLALAADPRFRNRIYADALNGLFGQQPLIPLKLKSAVQSFPRTEETLPLIAGIDRILDTAALGGRVGWLALDETGPATQIRQFAPAVVAVGILTQDEVNALLALAGGDYLTRLSEAEVAELLAEFDAEDEASERRARVGDRRAQLERGYQAAIHRLDEAAAGREELLSWEDLAAVVLSEGA